MDVSSTRIVQLTDCHLLADKAISAYGCNPYNSLKKVAELISTIEFDLLLLTGDFSEEKDPSLALKSYQYLTEIIGQLAKPDKVYWMAGNHDAHEHISLAFADYNSAKQISLPGWQLVLVNQQYVGTQGVITESEYSRLEQLVRDGQNTLLVNHHPPGKMNFWMDRHAIVDHHKWQGWLLRQRNISLYLHGHTHCAREYQLGHIDVLASPSSCWQWKTSEEFAVDVNAKAGVRELTLFADGSYQSHIRVIN